MNPILTLQNSAFINQYSPISSILFHACSPICDARASDRGHWTWTWGVGLLNYNIFVSWAVLCDNLTAMFDKKFRFFCRRYRPRPSSFEIISIDVKIYQAYICFTGGLKHCCACLSAHISACKSCVWHNHWSQQLTKLKFCKVLACLLLFKIF